MPEARAEAALPGQELFNRHFGTLVLVFKVLTRVVGITCLLVAVGRMIGYIGPILAMEMEDSEDGVAVVIPEHFRGVTLLFVLVGVNLVVRTLPGAEERKQQAAAPAVPVTAAVAAAAGAAAGAEGERSRLKAE